MLNPSSLDELKNAAVGGAAVTPALHCLSTRLAVRRLTACSILGPPDQFCCCRLLQPGLMSSRPATHSAAHILKYTES